MAQSLLESSDWIEALASSSQNKLLAVFVDLDSEKLSEYPDLGPSLAYHLLHKELRGYFEWRLGPVFISSSYHDAKDVTINFRRVVRRFDWLKASLKEVRLLQISQLQDFTSSVKS